MKSFNQHPNPSLFTCSEILRHRNHFGIVGRKVGGLPNLLCLVSKGESRNLSRIVLDEESKESIPGKKDIGDMLYSAGRMRARDKNKIEFPHIKWHQDSTLGKLRLVQRGTYSGTINSASLPE